MKKCTYIYILLIIGLSLAFQLPALAQEKNTYLKRSETPLLTIKGSVLDVQTMSPISKVNVEVKGGDYTATNGSGDFTIRARVGDELVIRNAGFETVYYTITDTERIRIEVHPEALELDVEETVLDDFEQRQLSFEDNLELGRVNYKKDAAQGLDYVANALGDKTISSQQRAEAFALLAEIYSYWKQYDLAVTNYRLSLREFSSLDRQIALAKTYHLNKNYQESIELSSTIFKSRLRSPIKMEVQENLGDSYTATGDIANAEKVYQALLGEAKSRNDRTTSTRITTKLANLFANSGAQQKAKSLYDDALEISNQEVSANSAKVKVQAADYYNKTKSYDEEIALRKEVLNSLNEAVLDSLSNEEPITSQKQNYKIASAYVSKKELDEAIPFFEKSIAEAAEREDLIVEKDATRRLSEVFRDKGDFELAIASLERYQELVDENYIQKEQELAQARRFGKELAEKQNRIASLEKDRALNESRYQLAFRDQELTDGRNLRQNIIIGALALITIMLLLTAFAMYRSSKQQKYANNLLALKGLRSQMNPHFIFNALNSVNSFIASNDERTANKYLSDFSILMRSVLENSEEDFIPLSKEIELIEKYVMLEHFRFKDKFEYSLEIDPDLDVEAFEIPPMLLQPYVENAVWHGMRYKEEKGSLKIEFTQTDTDTAIITVTDDGVGRTRSKELKTDNQKKQKSKGMSNIKKRISILNEMYGDRVDVAISDVYTTGEGTKVSLTIKKD